MAYHIDPTLGEPAHCRQARGKCSVAEVADHYGSISEAVSERNRQNEARTALSV